MLSPRKETILKSLVGQYIAGTRPVPSQRIIRDCELELSPATIRNEMAQLEEEGYIIRPHTSAGSIPSDKGYRHYVESIEHIRLPLEEQRLLSHLFHQVEEELDEWLSLAAALVAQMVQNAAILTMPKPEACKFRHLELVSIQDSVVLLILVLSGAKVKEQLMTFDKAVSQSELTTIATKLSVAYSGLTSSQILSSSIELSAIEQQVTDCIVKIVEAQNAQEYEEPYLDGLHFTLNQPEFVRNYRIALNLMELVEQRSLLRSIIPLELTTEGVHIVIGRENKEKAIHDYSVVISQYGLPKEAAGTIGVIGPTRMPYARTIATVDYLSSLLSGLVARLYGKETTVELDRDATKK